MDTYRNKFVFSTTFLVCSDVNKQKLGTYIYLKILFYYHLKVSQKLLFNSVRFFIKKCI